MSGHPLSSAEALELQEALLKVAVADPAARARLLMAHRLTRDPTRHPLDGASWCEPVRAGASRGIMYIRSPP